MSRLKYPLLLCMILGCSRESSSGKPAHPQGVEKPESQELRVQESEVKFGEPVASGDLIVTAVSCRSARLGGKQYGTYRNGLMTLVQLTVANTHNGKIAEWPGWQGRATLEDEHGNKFKPLALDGWSDLPNNGKKNVDPDYKDKVHPGKTMRSGLYFEYVPETSKTVILTATLDGKVVRFRGERNLSEKKK